MDEDEGISTGVANFITATEKTLSMYQSQNHCRVNSHYPRLYPHKTQAQMCQLAYIPIPQYARLVDSPSCLSLALSPSLLPPPSNFYKYIIHVHAHTHFSTCTQTLPVYSTMYLSFPNLNNEQTRPHSESITSSQLVDSQRSTEPSFSTTKVKLFITGTAH